jgi:hypothetical protein
MLIIAQHYLQWMENQSPSILNGNHNKQLPFLGMISYALGKLHIAFFNQSIASHSKK